MSSPSFEIQGNPGAIETKATTLKQKGEGFTLCGDGLKSITTGGWSGRAADRFKERFEVEPQRWIDAGTGFTTAANALTTYASALRTAQSEAAGAKADYEKGNQETATAKKAYDADVAQAKKVKSEWEAENGPGPTR